MVAEATRRKVPSRCLATGAVAFGKAASARRWLLAALILAMPQRMVVDYRRASLLQTISAAQCMIHRAWVLLLLTLAVSARAATPAGTEAVSGAAPSEYQLKSAFIYKFATFIDWPDNVGKTLTLCVAVPQEALPYFRDLTGKPVNAMTVAVRPLGADDSAEGCRILFVAASESDRFDDWLSEVGDQSVLTIGESDDWLRKGVVIKLAMQDKRVAFDVNLEAARGESIVISSRLLRLARKVYGLDTTDEPADQDSD